METPEQTKQRMREEIIKWYNRKDEDCQTMEPKVAIKFHEAILDVADIMSPPRAKNLTHDIFQPVEEIPLSDSIGLAEYYKTETQKYAICKFEYIRSADPHFQWKFITYSDLAAYGKMGQYLDAVEKKNYPVNFNRNIYDQDGKFIGRNKNAIHEEKDKGFQEQIQESSPGTGSDLPSDFEQDPLQEFGD